MAHEHYNRTNYPRRVWQQRESNWDIYADARGQCAAIPTKPGALASHYGDLAHVARIKREDAERRGFNIYHRNRSVFLEA